MHPTSIIETYARQYRWRSWSTILQRLPDPSGQAVIDLGSGIGDLARDFCDRGASVIGIDGNEDLIRHAQARRIERAEFRLGDVSSLECVDELFDGIWASFTAAYFPNKLPMILSRWRERLKPGGWIALTEVDDLFGHEPVSTRTRELLNAYADDALTESRYDFKMGGKLAGCLNESGFNIFESTTVSDAEFSFIGAASSDVVAAWQSRFDNLYLLKQFCGNEFESVRSDFLNSLTRDDHISHCAVCVCLATSFN